MNQRLRFTFILVGILGVLAPSAAWACPVCASRETNTPLIAVMLGLMIAVPYAIAVVVIRLVRKLDSQSVWGNEGPAAADGGAIPQ